jgi:hypothetical protein
MRRRTASPWRATRATGRWRFLADASLTLDTSIEYEETIKNTVRLAVPEVADFSVVILLQALAEAIALGLKAGLERDRLLDVLGSTVVLTASQRSKLANVKAGTYPPTFPLRLMLKDFGLILGTAGSLSVAMPTTAAAQQVCADEAEVRSAEIVESYKG